MLNTESNMRKLILLLFTFMSINSFALDIIDLTPLENSKILRIDYNKGILNIQKIGKDTTDIYYSCKSSWGAWNISKDKRKVLIYENGMHDLYLLDGNTGSITYKGNFNQYAFPDASFKYLITSKLVPKDNMLNLFVFDFETMQELYNFPWISQRENFKELGWISFEFFRSLNEKYDFVIYALGESGEQLGYYYLNATTRDFEEYNTFLDEYPSKTPYENGWE